MTASGHCSNITAAGERRRRLGGYAAAGAAVIVAIGLASRDAPSAAWLVLFPIVLAAAFNLLQVRAKTCVFHGYRGTEEVEGGGIRRVTDEGMRVQARRQAATVLWKAVVVALVVTAIAVVMSGITISFGG